MFSASKTAAASTGGVNYIEDVFSTYLYTGTGASQTITNGIDLSTKGGLVWIKARERQTNHVLIDSTRSLSSYIASNLTNGSITPGWPAFTLNSNGFTIPSGSYGEINTGSSLNTYASWTFRKQPKFFDVVTYTGNGATGRNISHNLGSVPGCIIVRRYDTIAGWDVYHQSLGATKAINLQGTGAAFTDTIWNSTSPTSTVFTVNGSANTNTGTYVAYLFAHNAGGFGLTGTDNVISCGSITAAGAGSINLGYEPQWILLKCSTAAGGWYLIDNMRGWVADVASNSKFLSPNTSAAESDITGVSPTATGFNYDLGSGQTYIYIAIRRGPMKVPTSGTSVFKPITFSTPNTFQTTNFVVDAVIENLRAGWARNSLVTDRLRGATQSLETSNSSVESSAISANSFAYNNGYYDSTTSGSVVSYTFQRAPSFFDEVCYTGTGNSGQAYSHNLGVVPEMIIVKCRSNATTNWPVYVSGVTGFTNWLPLNLTNALVPSTNQYQGTSTTTFTVGNDSQINGSGRTYVAYLFASCPGVSKVGSYTGTGATQTISCGFTGGARFVLIKRTDSTGDWYVWDTARGMVSGTDPSLLLNSTAAEVNANSVYTTTGGFQIVSTAAGINASGGTYIYLAIA